MGITHLSGLDVAGVPTMGSAPLPLIVSPNGKYIFVNSSNGSNGNTGMSADQPLATIDYAMNLCTANNGDVIIVGQGHAETLTAAGAITCDVAGVSIIGCGTGSDRPELTFGTAVTASVLISAANVQIANIVGISGIDALTQPFDVRAAGCTLGNLQNGPIEWQDDSTGPKIAVRQVLTTSAADNLRVNLKVVGLTTGGTPAVNAVRLVGVDGAIINLDFYGRASTAVVELITTVCTNIEVYGYIYNSGAAGAKNVIDTQGSSTWYANINDGAVGQIQAGGSGSALAGTSGWSLARKIIPDCTVLTTAASPVTAFTVTGDVIVRVFGTVQTSVTSTGNTGTLAVGVTGATTALLGTTTANGTQLAATQNWTDTGPAIADPFAAANLFSGNAIASGLDIIITIATNNMTAGAITLYCFWQPLSAGASVVAA